MVEQASILAESCIRQEPRALETDVLLHVLYLYCGQFIFSCCTFLLECILEKERAPLVRNLTKNPVLSQFDLIWFCFNDSQLIVAV